ncbi:metaxin-2-like [Amphiura filiformis]|uniref:metaxin-2-like n=1 Tax=Amphiura filiformis TaxID=82378 RepID=UPI003B214F12
MAGLSLSEDLSGPQKSELKAYMALTINRLKLAELYVTWQDKHSSEAITKPRYGSPYPWPLQHLLPWMKQREMKRYLKVQEWSDKTVEQVHAEVNLCCKALSDKLGEQYYFFLDRPTELDALVYGHLNSLLTTKFTSVQLAEDVQRYPNLVRFCERITERYFTEGGER